MRTPNPRVPPSAATDAHGQGVRTMTTALLVVDMQEALVAGAFDEQDVLARIDAVIGRARVQGVPVIYVQHNHATFTPMMKGSPGWRIHARIAPQSGDAIIEKEASDAFYATNLESTLRFLNVETLVVAGMMTEYCVDTTARSALSHDFDVVLLSDGHTTGNGASSAAQIIAHHNAVLPNVVHPTRRIRLVPSAELTFT